MASALFSLPPLTKRLAVGDVLLSPAAGQQNALSDAGNLLSGIACLPSKLRTLRQRLSGQSSP